MLPTKIYFTGLQILFSLHIAHSFVLLTANVEDLRKLARKFVSDEFAEKIVQILAKATSSLLTPAPNVSEENEANVDDIQKVSDNEVMDPYKGGQGPKLALRTTPSRYVDNSREVLRPKHNKVNSQYAESNLRSQELTELSEYRNPLQLPIVKPKDYLFERTDQKSMNILRQNPQPQYLVAQKPDRVKEALELSNAEQIKPKISYHKSQITDENRNFGAQYASVNIGGGNRGKHTPSSEDRYFPVTEQADKERKPKILDLKYQTKKDRNKGKFGKFKEIWDNTRELIGKDKERKDKNEEYHLGKVKNLADKEREEKHKKMIGKVNEKSEVKPNVMEKVNNDPQIARDTSKNDTLHMFIQKGGHLQEVSETTTGKERMEFDQYQPRNKHKRASRPRKTKYD